ncbi:MAG: DUF3800 domain-containing protein [Anaerolineae bacterium]|nr:DUF3800 domain-containing protein [Anaerolineae bacterium]
MKTSFVAYIDESGDEGFTFHQDGSGSSRWFLLSATVFRRSNEPSGVSALKAARQTLGWETKKPFHFTNMKHEQRLVLLHRIALLPARTVTVISYKPDILDIERYQANKCLLYRYLTRLLIERVSWLCRDHYKAGEGDGVVDLIFSDRASMSYDDIRDYIGMLKQQSEAGAATVNIHWPVINIQNLRAIAHSHLAGLQIADAVATSYLYGMRLSRLNVADPSYMRLLRPKAYKYRGNCFGYGVKFLSSLEDLKNRMPHLHETFDGW